MSERVWTLSCKDTMSQSWHMDSLARANHIPWEHRLVVSRAIISKWVCIIFFLSPSHGRISLPGLSNHCDLIGVIPRAASVLFQKLQGPPSLKRSGSSGSGLRTPTRYSMHGTQGLASMAKAQSQPDKNWQIKATYVEVRHPSNALRLASNLSRSTMSNFAIYSSQRMPRPRNEGQ